MELYRGLAYGEVSEAKSALHLWACVACGGAPMSDESGAETPLGNTYSNFLTLVDALDSNGCEYISVLAEAALKILSECERAEGQNRATAWIRQFRNNRLLAECMDQRPTSIVFCWAGQWTRNREIALELRIRRKQWHVTFAWDTGTGKESCYLGLPSMATGGDWTSHQQIPPRAEDIIEGGKAAFAPEQYKSAAVRFAMKESYKTFVDTAHDLARLENQVRRNGYIISD